MSWEDIKPAPKRPTYGSDRASPVMISVGRFGRSQDYRLVIQVYVAKLAADNIPNFDWWKEGTEVSIRQGKDIHSGMLIIDNNNGYFTLERIGSHGQCPVGVRLPLPKHLAAEARARVPANFQLLPNALQVTLPKWAVEPSLVLKQGA